MEKKAKYEEQMKKIKVKKRKLRKEREQELKEATYVGEEF